MDTSNPNHSNITTALGEQGLGDQPWWVEQWMELINSYRFKKRLERAWSYAREGNVTSIRFEGRRVHGRVQGTGEEPYKVKLWLDVLNDEDWLYVLEALTQKARWSAQLLAGIMPADIERAFAASGKRLFPFKLQEVRSECNCPDKANPCKHISAIYFLMGEQFRADPFVLFQLRGRSRAQLLQDLAEQRRKVLNEISDQNSKKNKSIKSEQSLHAHAAIVDPSMWWKYQGNLDPDLVVITSNIDGETGLNSAGELPLAEEPKYIDSGEKFINHLKEQGQIFSQKAMMQAMNSNN
tara:strand:+ start:1534 stop:2418 length:885 start_codon:yes stop_codon:yes gene_type:complete